MTDIDRQALRDFMATEVMGWELRYDAFYANGNYVRMIKIDWKPDLDSNQLDMLVDKMVEDGFEIDINLSPTEVPEIIICDPKLRENNRCYESGDDIVALIENPDRRLAVLLAIKAAKEDK